MKILSSLALFIALQLSALAASVTFQWDPSPDTNVSWYNFYYGLSHGSYAWNTSVHATNVTVQGLDPTKTYYAVVTAIETNGGLESDLSNECIIFPGPGGFVLATANKRQTVTLTWQPSTNAAVTKYYVYYGKSTNVIDRLTASVGVPTNTVTLAVPPGASALYCKMVASVGDELSVGGFTNVSWSAKLTLRWPANPGQLRLEAAD
jgi:hypothetical protein